MGRGRGRGGDDSSLYGVCGCCCCIIIVVVVILITVSFSVLSNEEVGLDLNNRNKQIDETQVFTAGRYFLGLAHKFIRYPKIVQTIRFDDVDATASPLRGRTKDGLAITIKCSIQYRLLVDIDSVLGIYRDFGQEYEQFYVIQARDIIRDVISEFTAFSVFQNRSTITGRMTTQLRENLADYYASLDSFQVLNILFPSQYDDAIQLTQVKKQEIDQALFNRQTAEVDAQTRVLTATKAAEVIELNANATAAGTRLQANAEAAALINNIGAEQNAFSNLFQALNMTSADDINAFIFTQAIRETPSQVILGVTLPEQLKF